jgi:8-oxo-dGTP diphosphatase
LATLSVGVVDLPSGIMRPVFDGSANLVLDLVPHCASTPRDEWKSQDDLRPLSDLGLRQADILGEVLGPVADAVYSSPSLRCRQSAEPLARAAGVPLMVDHRLSEALGFTEPASWVNGVFAPIGASLGGAWASGRAARAILPLATRHAGGHVVVCSHGDIIPAVLSYLAAAYSTALPAVVGRGGWYRLELRQGALSISSHLPGAAA